MVQIAIMISLLTCFSSAIEHLSDYVVASSLHVMVAIKMHTSEVCSIGTYGIR